MGARYRGFPKQQYRNSGVGAKALCKSVCGGTFPVAYSDQVVDLLRKIIRQHRWIPAQELAGASVFRAAAKESRSFGRTASRNQAGLGGRVVLPACKKFRTEYERRGIFSNREANPVFRHSQGK